LEIDCFSLFFFVFFADGVATMRVGVTLQLMLTLELGATQTLVAFGVRKLRINSVVKVLAVLTLPLW
jgi:hypothetical protein